MIGVVNKEAQLWEELIGIVLQTGNLNQCLRIFNQPGVIFTKKYRKISKSIYF
jgi:hypothetical protein